MARCKAGHFSLAFLEYSYSFPPLVNDMRVFLDEYNCQFQYLDSMEDVNICIHQINKQEVERGVVLIHLDTHYLYSTVRT